MILLPMMLPTFYYMERPAWSMTWYSMVVDACISDPWAEPVDWMGKIMPTTCKVLNWIKDCRGDELWRLCCSMIGPVDQEPAMCFSVFQFQEFHQEYVDIWSMMMDQLEYMNLLIKEFSRGPAEL